MKRMGGAARFLMVWALVPLMATQPSFGWGREGHSIINRLAAANLPRQVPLFLRDASALDAMSYLGPEPDRWRSRAESELEAEQAPDHFIDLEWADMVGTLPRRRYDFIRDLAKQQRVHPNLPLTAEKVGMQPWEVEEIYQRLRAGFREYRKLAAANEDTKPAQLAVIFYAGWLGHYVGDGSQPLHTTVHYNGWSGPNPNGYTTERHIHSKFESAFVAQNVKAADVASLVVATRTKVLGDEWDDYMTYLRHTHSLVEKTYQIDKAAGFDGAGTAESKAFAEERLAAGAIELRNLIYTAWLRSADPVPEG